MTRVSIVPLLAAGAAITVLVIVGWAGHEGASGGPPIGVALSAEDRTVLAATEVVRGDPADVSVQASVDPRDPEAVARAYLAAAHSITATDADRTHRRAAGYAVPESPPATVGVVVLDPPPAGSVRTATVTGLELVAADRGNRRRGYRAEVGTATGPTGGAVAVGLLVRHVVLARQSDGRWLVAAESTATPDLPAGED